MQWYETIEKCQLPVETIEKTLNRVRVRWQRSVGETGRYSVSREFVLISLDGIRGGVRLVLTDSFIYKFR